MKEKQNFAETAVPVLIYTELTGDGGTASTNVFYRILFRVD